MESIPKSGRFQGFDGSLNDTIVAIQISTVWDLLVPTMCILGSFCLF